MSNCETQTWFPISIGSLSDGIIKHIEKCRNNKQPEGRELFKLSGSINPIRLRQRITWVLTNALTTKTHNVYCFTAYSINN